MNRVNKDVHSFNTLPNEVVSNQFMGQGDEFGEQPEDHNLFRKKTLLGTDMRNITRTAEENFIIVSFQN